MTKRLKTTVLLALFASGAVPLNAQWPAQPSPKVPKTADGKPDLAAPTPRTADGKPDLSGLWENTWMVQFRRAVPQASPTVGGPPLATFADIGLNVPGGLPLRPWAADLFKARKEQ